MDEEIVWTGGDTVVVQLGDVLDRGDHEIGERLAVYTPQAPAPPVVPCTSPAPCACDVIPSGAEC